MTSNVFLGLGSNVGDKLNYIKEALKKINNKTNSIIEAVSSAYVTAPWGYAEQNEFINLVVKISTNLEPLDLFNYIKNIESDLGRSKTIKWGPREIDVDILFYNNLIYKDDIINIPHKELVNRDFVLIPLIEIAADFIHPVLKIKLSDIDTKSNQKTIKLKLADKLHL